MHTQLRASSVIPSQSCSQNYLSSSRQKPVLHRRCNIVIRAQNQPTVDAGPRVPTPPPPPPPPPPQAKTGWPQPSRRDLIAAGVGSVIGGAAMFIYDTVVINNLYDEIDDLEDELELAAEEAYLTEAAIEDADASADVGGTMADLEGKK